MTTPQRLPLEGKLSPKVTDEVDFILIIFLFVA